MYALERITHQREAHMSQDAAAQEPAEETVYRTEHFEATPYMPAGYAIFHKDSGGHFAHQHVFPDDVVERVLGAMQVGFYHGVKAVEKSIKQGLGQFVDMRIRALTQGSAVVQKGTRPALAYAPEFPLYLMVVDGQERFMPLQEAGATYDSGWAQVDIGGKVLEAGYRVRNITREEEAEISRIADAHSESK